MTLYLIVAVALVVGGVVGTASTWLVLRRKKPVKKAEKQSPPEPQRLPIDEAYRMLDQLEKAAADGVFGFPPSTSQLIRLEEARQKRQEKKMATKPLVDSPNHPCEWLSNERPQNFREGECSGVCYQPDQRGRLCFWAAAAASMCEVFRPRVKPATTRPRAAIR